jgi:hypothetical protein
VDTRITSHFRQRWLLKKTERCADPESVGEGLGRRDVLQAVGGGGLEEVGVRGRGRLGAEAEREGELEVVGLLRLLRPAFAAVAAQRPVRVAHLIPVLRGGEGGDRGREPSKSSPPTLLPLDCRCNRSIQSATASLGLFLCWWNEAGPPSPSDATAGG